MYTMVPSGNVSDVPLQADERDAFIFAESRPWALSGLIGSLAVCIVSFGNIALPKRRSNTEYGSEKALNERA